MKWREDLSVSDMVGQHFRYGPLRAYDVRQPTGAADAFRQAFYAWYARQTPKQFKRLTFRPALFDSHALQEHLHHCGTGDNNGDPSPLFFGIELPEEWVFTMARAATQLREAHPLLLDAVLSAIGKASARTVFLRLPDWFMYEFSCWFWDGDESISDQDADEMLKERFGEDNETRAAYLPSVVRGDLLPDGTEPRSLMHGTILRRQTLRPVDLTRLRPCLSGMPRRVCTVLLRLDQLLRKSRTRDLFHVQYQTNPVYSAASLVMRDCRWIGELLDTHFENESNMGEATTYQGFSAFATHPNDIRRQYNDWSLGLQVLACLDLLLTLVSEPV
ncbi:PRTRC system protein F [Paraburkholderia megapolitana]|uniref:PRTRC system protein F n=1 Tax=Paraburkholderia megapolitana TaxID=420953 RepID=UPI0038B7CC66